MAINHDEADHYCVLYWDTRPNRSEIKTDIFCVPSVVFIHAKEHALLLTPSALLMISGHTSCQSRLSMLLLVVTVTTTTTSYFLSPPKRNSEL